MGGQNELGPNLFTHQFKLAIPGLPRIVLCAFTRHLNTADHHLLHTQNAACARRPFRGGSASGLQLMVHNHSGEPTSQVPVATHLPAHRGERERIRATRHREHIIQPARQPLA